MKGMETKEDCPYKWYTIFSYSFSIIILYYSLMEYGTLYGIYKEYFNIPEFDFHFNLIISIQYFFLFCVILFVGVVTDKYGPGFCFLMQALIIVVGQFLVCVSVYSKYFYLMYLARCLICLGCSSIAISKGVFCRDYFHSTHLALTNSMTSMSYTISQILNLYFVWLVYNNYGLMIVELFALFLCVLGLVLVYFIYRIDTQNNKYLLLYNFKSEYQNLSRIKEGTTDPITHTENQLYQVNQQDITARNSNGAVYVSQLQVNAGQNSSNQKGTSSVIESYLKDISVLPKSYWFGSATVAISYFCLMSYVILGPAICQEYLDLKPQEASYYAALLPNVTLIMPLLGRIIDHYKSWFNVFYMIGFFAVSGSLLLLFKFPAAAFIMIGLGYGSRTTAEFPLICYLSHKKIAGRAYSITRALSNITLSLIMLLNSLIVEYTGSYFYTLIVFLTSSLLISISITVVKYLHNLEVTAQQTIQSDLNNQQNQLNQQVAQNNLQLPSNKLSSQADPSFPSTNMSITQSNLKPPIASQEQSSISTISIQ